MRPIAHAYPDELPAPAEVRCYGFEELFAEKIRAMGERPRPRDLYDIVNLFRRHHPEANATRATPRHGRQMDESPSGGATRGR